uniref:Odorant binding protein n=1 Tax=Heliothis virescens TaxID=7102 RepID=A0A2A4JW49_HELVI
MFKVELALVILFLGLVHCHNKTHVKTEAIQMKKRYQMECIEETRVDADAISEVRKGHWSVSKEQLQLVKDWALCAMIKSGLMTKQGVYKIDVALQKVPRTERYNAEKLIDKCLSTKAIPAPDIAFEFVKCYQKTNANYTVSIF